MVYDDDSDAVYVNQERLIHVNEDSDKETGTSEVQTIVSVLCTTIGVGILALPRSFGDAGWFAALIIIAVGFISTHTAKLLIACLHVDELETGQRFTTYEDIGEAALGKWGRRLVAILQNITLFGVCTVFLVITGRNMNQLIDNLTLHEWIFIFGLIVLPFSWLKTMKEISLLAYMGIFTSLFVGAVILVEGFNNLHSNSATYQYINWGGVPRAFNLIVFSFGNHSVLPNIESHMKSPKRFPWVANVSYVTIALVYIIVATGGYAGWGTGVQDTILNNLDPSSVVVKMSLALLTVHVVTTYPIPLNPCALALEDITGVNKLFGTKEVVARVLLRTALVVGTVFIASVVPYFGDLITIVTSISVVFVAYLLPCLFYYILLHRSDKAPLTFGHSLYLIAISALALAGSVSGMYFGVKDLIDDIDKHPNPFNNYF